MKQRDFKNSLKQMNANDLFAQAHTLRQELFVLRMKHIANPEKNTALAKELRKKLACALTFLNQKDVYVG